MNVPIFTFWVALRPVTEKSTSHLRICPGSHALPDMELREDQRNVIPKSFRYSSRNFVGPKFPEGYTVGDVVVFHCLTQHEANPHTSKEDASKRGKGERISMDGRFFLDVSQLL